MDLLLYQFGNYLNSTIDYYDSFIIITMYYNAKLDANERYTLNEERKYSIEISAR